MSCNLSVPVRYCSGLVQSAENKYECCARLGGEAFTTLAAATRDLLRRGRYYTFQLCPGARAAPTIYFSSVQFTSVQPNPMSIALLSSSYSVPGVREPAARPCVRLGSGDVREPLRARARELPPGGPARHSRAPRRPLPSE